MNYAQSQNGVVVQVLRVHPAAIVGESGASLFRACPDEVQVGWLDDGDAFTAPPMPLRSEAITLQKRAIKAERDRRKSGGFFTGTEWFHSDEASRGQYGLLLTTALEKGLPAGYVLNASWMDMAGVYAPMTVAKLRLIRDVGIVLESALFDAAKNHIAAMADAADPSAYDFSRGWPATYSVGA
jgi:hypothetical protein